MNSGDSTGWLVHDVVVGALAGASAGVVVGLFALARVDRAILAGVAVVAFVVAVIALLRWERHHRRGAGPVTILAWIFMVLCLAFIALVINAIRTFT
jgi:hypothetical protein